MTWVQSGETKGVFVCLSAGLRCLKLRLLGCFTLSIHVLAVPRECLYRESSFWNPASLSLCLAGSFKPRLSGVDCALGGNSLSPGFASWVDGSWRRTPRARQREGVRCGGRRAIFFLGIYKKSKNIFVICVWQSENKYIETYNWQKCIFIVVWQRESKCFGIYQTSKNAFPIFVCIKYAFVLNIFVIWIGYREDFFRNIKCTFYFLPTHDRRRIFVWKYVKE